MSFEIQLFHIFYVIIFLSTPQDKSSSIKKTKNEPVQTIRFNTFDTVHSSDCMFHHVGQKLPPVEEILKRPQAVKPQVAVVPTPDRRKGGVLPVLSVINEKGRVDGAVCRDQSAGSALCKAALTQKRPKRYEPAKTCSNQTDATARCRACVKTSVLCGTYLLALW